MGEGGGDDNENRRRTPYSRCRTIVGESSGQFKSAPATNCRKPLCVRYLHMSHVPVLARARYLCKNSSDGAPAWKVNCRVGGDVAIPTPHRPGRADFPHPVLHERDSLAAA